MGEIKKKLSKDRSKKELQEQFELLRVTDGQTHKTLLSGAETTNQGISPTWKECKKVWKNGILCIILVFGCGGGVVVRMNGRMTLLSLMEIKAAKHCPERMATVANIAIYFLS